ncbi:Uncharacterised protein [Bordetella pertussis]|nr:Uncharacterised protein [Bordetella pertussis]CFW35107.1 Uncharacterised protein [Bordetella pertussis]
MPCWIAVAGCTEESRVLYDESARMRVGGCQHVCGMVPAGRGWRVGGLRCYFSLAPVSRTTPAQRWISSAMKPRV